MFDPLTRTLTVGGRSFTASPLSVEQVRAWQDAHDAAEGKADSAAQERALTALLRLAFPAKWSMLWTGDPVRLVRQLPAPEMERTMASFFLWCGSRLLTT